MQAQSPFHSQQMGYEDSSHNNAQHDPLSQQVDQFGQSPALAPSSFFDGGFGGFGMNLQSENNNGLQMGLGMGMNMGTGMGGNGMYGFDRHNPQGSQGGLNQFDQGQVAQYSQQPYHHHQQQPYMSQQYPSAQYSQHYSQQQQQQSVNVEQQRALPSPWLKLDEDSQAARPLEQPDPVSVIVCFLVCAFMFVTCVHVSIFV